MAWSRWTRVTAVLCAGVLLVALVAPAAALAAVGGPYSESVSNPEDNGIIVVGPAGGSFGVGASGKLRFVVPAGALLSSKTITSTVTTVGGRKTQDGATLAAVMEFEPDGLVFEHPIIVSLVYPPGLRNPRAYGYDDVLDTWQALPSSNVEGDRLFFEANHFSAYGVGGSSVTSSVPADSSWSLGLLTMLGAGAIGLATLRVRRGAGV